MILSWKIALAAIVVNLCGQWLACTMRDACEEVGYSNGRKTWNAVRGFLSLICIGFIAWLGVAIILG